MINLRVKYVHSETSQEWRIPGEFFENHILKRGLIYQWDGVIWLLHSFTVENPEVLSNYTIGLSGAPREPIKRVIEDIIIQSSDGEIKHASPSKFQLLKTTGDLLLANHRVISINGYDMAFKSFDETLVFIAYKFGILPEIDFTTNEQFPHYDVDYFDVSLLEPSSNNLVYKRFAGKEIEDLLDSLVSDGDTLFSDHGIITHINGEFVDRNFINKLSNYTRIVLI